MKVFNFSKWNYKKVERKIRAFFWLWVRRVFRRASWALWSVFAVFTASFLWVMFLTSGGGLFAWLLGGTGKRAALEYIGLGIGGVVAIMGALAINQRAKEMARTNMLTEKGHINERFKSAVESLTNTNPSARIASFYQFYYLAKENPSKEFRKNILDILCAHLRQTTSTKKYREELGKDEPTEEIQSLLNVLFPKKKRESIFADGVANLANSYLVGANMSSVNFYSVSFAKAELMYANFIDAELNSASLIFADLRKSMFFLADLGEANFKSSKLQGADLFHTEYLDMDFDGIEIDEETRLPRNIEFADKSRKIYRTDENGIPQEMQAGE